MKIENKKVWISVFLLITLDQVTKIIISNNYLHKSFPILPPLLYFEPMFNRYYSWFNSMLQFNSTRWVHIAIVAIMTILIYLFYQYVSKRLASNKMINIMFAFIFSAAVCSLIDKIFWDGSLDYILIKGFFTFDLKDVYINIFIGLLILSLFLKNDVYKEIDDKNIVKDFAKFILRKS